MKAQFDGAPDAITYQGYLTDAGGDPVNSPQNITVRLFDAESAGTELWERAYTDVPVSEGVFQVYLADGTPAFSSISFDNERWVEIEVGGQVLGSLIPLTSAPYALGLRNLRVVPESESLGPNMIGGWSGNAVAEGMQGATISGGGGPSTFAGFGPNAVSQSFGSIGGGYANTAGGLASTIAGGGANSALGAYAVVPGGNLNQAGGPYSFAAGYRAKIRDISQVAPGAGPDSGTFVWADSQNEDFVSDGPNQFLIRASGGVGIGTNNPVQLLTVAGNAVVENLSLSRDNASRGALFLATTNDIDVALYSNYSNLDGAGSWDGVKLNTVGGFNLQVAGNSGRESALYVAGNKRVGIDNDSPGHPLHMASGAHVTDGGVWTDFSSRTGKQDFESVDVGAVLDAVAELPILRWRYKREPDAVHMGPVAEDFYAAFQLGADNRHLAALDGNGVALAAIQALQKENAELRTLLAEQEKRLSLLEERLPGQGR